MAAPTANEKKNISSNSSHIPDDISLMILSKLPVKSWSLLLENHDFFKKFRNNVISKSHPLYDDACQILTQYERPCWNVYLFSGDKFENKVKLDFPPSSFHRRTPQCSFTPFSVLGSAVNGILCIFDIKYALLWNPATEEIKVILPGFAEFKHDLTTFIKRCGFGYDHITHDYKVIQHVDYIGSRIDKYPMLKPFWEIYSLKSNSWRKIDIDIPTMSWSCNNGVYFDGVCHWQELSNKLVSFNLCNEMCFITPSFLEDLPNDFDVVNLNVLNGCVAIITSRIDSTSFQISILGEFGIKESWIKLFDIERMSCNIYPIGIGMNGNIFFKTNDDKHEITCLNLTTGLIEEIDLKGNRFSCQVVIYKRNLHPIREIRD
ncbi:hypothetical protein TSUD_16230 [Trifolium subterraneum]|uniref:F-box associated beta-propeller type 1 domain-containing protein n=1 Tax=Trifolium subterraneum TaxID=3900 RepID=A0A2Z6NDU3_TRISU|nr:hypothetical protein TSUD_16230 [Trifolium subterraneum]